MKSLTCCIKLQKMFGTVDDENENTLHVLLLAIADTVKIFLDQDYIKIEKKITEFESDLPWLLLSFFKLAKEVFNDWFKMISRYQKHLNKCRM